MNLLWNWQIDAKRLSALTVALQDNATYCSSQILWAEFVIPSNLIHSGPGNNLSPTKGCRPDT